MERLRKIAQLLLSLFLISPTTRWTHEDGLRCRQRLAESCLCAAAAAATRRHKARARLQHSCGWLIVSCETQLSASSSWPVRWRDTQARTDADAGARVADSGSAAAAAAATAAAFNVIRGHCARLRKLHWAVGQLAQTRPNCSSAERPVNLLWLAQVNNNLAAPRPAAPD